MGNALEVLKRCLVNDLHRFKAIQLDPEVDSNKDSNEIKNCQ